MSQRLRPLTHSLRALEALPGPSNTSSRAARIISTRRALHASTVTRSAQVAPATTPAHSGNIYADETGRFYDQQERRAVFKARTAEEVASMKQHVDALLGLSFPPELVQRMLTHASHIDAVNGHNQRLSFIGRRVLESYFLLFLHSSPGAKKATTTSSTDEPLEIDYADLTERVINTYWFGEHVGTPWQLGRYMRWVSPEERAAQAALTQAAAESRGETPVRSHKPRSTQQQVGLYKIAGTTMEAVVGGVYHQFGAAAAHRLFHTRILPLMPNLPRAFASHAQAICEKMGGPNAPLLVAKDAKTGAKSSVTGVESSEVSSRAGFEAEAPKSRSFNKAPSSRERFPERMQREKLAL